MYCFDPVCIDHKFYQEPAPLSAARDFCRLAESSTRLPDDQSGLKHYFLKERIGFCDPVQKQLRRDLAELLRSGVDSRQ